MSIKFPTFNANIDIYAKNKQEIITLWMRERILQKVLTKYDITVDYFSEHFAIHMLNYFIAVVKGEQSIGDCPAINKFLLYLSDKNISEAALFDICAKFRKAMADFTFKKGIMTAKMYDEFTTIFDRNFHGVLASYSKTIKNISQDVESTTLEIAQYREALEQSSIISMVDAQGIITYANKAFCDITGYKKDELRGQSYNLIRHEPTGDAHIEDMWRKAKEREMFIDTIAHTSKSGVHYYLDMVVLPIYDRYKEVKGYITVAHDITNHYTSVENALEAKATALQAEQAKDDFLSSMSHEIRTPMNAILGFVRLLQNTPLNPKQSGYLTVIKNSGNMLLTIINGILDFAKIKSGKFEIDPFEFSPSREFEQTLELFASKMFEKDINYLCHIDANMPVLVKADAIRMKQILSNFLSNAIKFTPQGGKVKVKIIFDEKKSMLSMYVKDTGPGIKAKYINQIFTAFSQEEKSTARNFGGTGLGLSISEQLAHLMKGKIGVKSTYGKGAIFYCHIPVHVVDKNRQTTDAKTINIVKKGINTHQLKLIKSYAKGFGIKAKFWDVVPDDSITPLFCALSYASKVEDKLEALNNTDVKNIIILEHMQEEHAELQYDFKVLYYPFMTNKFLEALKNKGEDVGEQTAVKKMFKGNVLVAEDNKTNQMLIGILLEEYGIHFEIAQDGQVACARYAENSYDLILMDNNMPNMTGVEATRWILEYEQKNHQNYTPIVALTANASNADREMFLSNGFDNYLSKPIDVNALEQVLETYLSPLTVTPTIEGKETEKIVVSKNTINLQELSQTIGLPEKLIQRLVDTFFEDTPNVLKQLEEAIDSNSIKNIELYAHCVKGSASNLALSDLQEKAKEMEFAAKAKDKGYEYPENFKVLSEIFTSYKV